MKSYKWLYAAYVVSTSLPVRGAWIEIKKLTINIGFSHVAPRAGSVD